jgi:hypothetical protein
MQFGDFQETKGEIQLNGKNGVTKGFHWLRGARRTKPQPGGPSRVADQSHFCANQPETWQVCSLGGGKGESEAEEAVPPHCMADRPRGGCSATHLH